MAVNAEGILAAGGEAVGSGAALQLGGLGSLLLFGSSSRGGGIGVGLWLALLGVGRCRSRNRTRPRASALALAAKGPHGHGDGGVSSEVEGLVSQHDHGSVIC